MKTLRCDSCEATAEGETFEGLVQALMPHYMQAHSEVMSNPNHTKEDMEKWMKENKAKLEVASSK